MSETVLAAAALSKGFRSGEDTVRVIDRLSFTLSAGQSMAVIGRSGSGKSTLLNLLCGLETADAGDITVADQNFEVKQGVASPAATCQWALLRKRTIGVVFQEANLMPAMTLLENVQLRASLAGHRAGGEMHWLEQLGVGAEAHRFPDQVSGGQRQRAALAMVFAMHPEITLADEPTGSLDRQTAEEVADRLFEVQRQTGCALVMATHDQALASRCDHCLDLGEGG
ncbi:ABC transporter ATP-binding protein [Marinobacter confluentis]|uniref:ATP-binding cassette domain-containing protein n=1 Tax=Marinobacter confluentis TaxID=1697557 RepID=A0A4Z1BP72_9GAMM|nr:ATP-binding cassette domain-containing protein [Marinobacter confluentis]TGN39277.1 ATP-binding cassette domain-containing protein [Marinobacter confluentis]